MEMPFYPSMPEPDVENCEKWRELNGRPARANPSRKRRGPARKRAFALFIKSRQVSKIGNTSPQELGGRNVHWECCGKQFEEVEDIHKHVANEHMSEVLQQTEAIFKVLPQNNIQLMRKHDSSDNNVALPQHNGTKEVFDISKWLPDISHINFEELTCAAGEVLLYYSYCDIEEPQVICTWQKTLCRQLHFTGKVRISKEGINGTVGGCKTATELYIQTMLSHPLFQAMSTEDFKRSAGGSHCFQDLRVGVFKEVVPMGVDPEKVSYKDAGIHLTPEEFHRKVEALSNNAQIRKDTILLDCRNFYESKIDVCKEVYQLKGGIHKYLEQFPSGFYRGKLFVFDNRYAISANDDVIAECRYCGVPWDEYRLCSTSYCCQLVLSCVHCREKGLLACCIACQEKGNSTSETQSGRPRKEECECTQKRVRIPVMFPH
ncbi:thiosulfate sulfurtransferase/rhodanese-like domain-containing protein 2 isoform X2 [Scyliorhinus torazame]|uniref:thiosulfate sulfurtransferase/rhodanese-like domain-containing protein 2 isoform X2 n=1 Tax=Scyliorhinus torazame TaxID=75743 RepID=UPI003B5A05D2